MSRLRTLALCLDSVAAATRPFGDRDRQMVALRSATPSARQPGGDQADVGHLPLFVAGNEPRLL